jgi:hypothetical protein
MENTMVSKPRNYFSHVIPIVVAVSATLIAPKSSQFLSPNKVKEKILFFFAGWNFNFSM